MSKGTVAYVNRPNKDYVREELVRLIGIHSEAAQHPDKYCYVSLAGYRFIDLVSVYRSYRIRSMYSVEYEESLHKRAEFNKPYSWVEVCKGRLADFLRSYSPRLTGKGKVVFLDYTGRLSDETIEDLDALFLSDFFNDNGLLFLTLNAIHFPPTPYVKRVGPKPFVRREEFEDWLKIQIPDIVRRKLRARFPSKDVRELAKFTYRDTSPMCVFAFKIDETAKLPSTYASVGYEHISVPDLTPIEQHTLRRRSPEGTVHLSRLTGIPRNEVDFFLRHD